MMARLKMETLLVVNLSGLRGYRNSFERSLANFEIQWLGFSGNIIQDKEKPTILSARPFNVLFQAKCAQECPGLKRLLCIIFAIQAYYTPNVLIVFLLSIQ